MGFEFDASKSLGGGRYNDDCFGFHLCSELWTWVLEFDKQDLEITGFSVTHTEIKDLDDLLKVLWEFFHKRRTRCSDFEPALPFAENETILTVPSF